MTTPASGTNKQVAIKEETTYGELPDASGAQLLRRVSFTANLAKDKYESNEISTTMQVVNGRHGVRRSNVSLNGELSPGSYAPLFAAMLKRDFAAVTSITGASITISGSGPTYTVARATGSWLTDGIKIGRVIRLSAGSFAAANLNKNLFVTAVTALSLSVITLNGSALVAEGPIASATVSLPGKSTFIPTSGHTDKSFSAEEWFADISQSETHTGIKFNQVSVQLPPTGLATVSFTGTGQDLGQPPGSTRYFTSPAAQSTSGLLGAVNGVLRANGATVATLTGFNFTIAPGFTGDPVVGANTVPFQFAGLVKVSGQFTAYFTDATLPSLFIDETETSIHGAFTTSIAAAADFVTFSMSRIVLDGADKDDGQTGVVRTYPFSAYLDTTGGAGAANEATTFAMQDSLA